MERIDITQKLAEFHDHLEQNPRTIFSARFGDGKTYFLREFMKSYGKDYFFVNIRPINYVVAPNEDVFEYIKRDILQELCMYNLVDDHVLKNVLKGIVNMDNAVEAVSFVAQTFLKLKTGIEAPIGETLKNFSANFNEHCQTLKKYNTSFEIQRGGIYEEDAYTMLIRESLLKVQERTKDSKKCVLVIEDLDRLDPGHLFRILNVLGAHIDDDKDTNKFGFDNIVLVMDYDTTRHIFHHFYGEEANYEGYMAKFIAGNPFYYSIKGVAIENLCNDIRNRYHQIITQAVIKTERKGSVNVDETLYQRFEKLSVRDIEKLLDNYTKLRICDTVKYRDYTIATDTPIVSLISILVLMNGVCSRYEFEGWLKKQENWYLYLGGFVYACEDYRGAYSENGNLKRSFKPTKREDGVITMVNITEDRSNQPGGPTKDEIIRIAIRAAQEVVLDGKALKWQ